MKKVLRFIASVLVLAMIVTGLPVMPVTETDAATGNSSTVGFHASASSGDYTMTDHPVMPLVIVQPYDYQPLSSRLPSDTGVEALYGDKSERYKVGLENDGNYYVSLVGQVNSARETVMYAIPKTDKNTMLAFEGMGMSKWTTLTKPTGSWFAVMGIGEFTGDNTVAQGSRAKINFGDGYRNNVVFAGITGKSGSYDSETENRIYREGGAETGALDNKKAYSQLKEKFTIAGGNKAIDDTYSGVYIDQLLKNNIIVWDDNYQGYRFNEDFGNGNIEKMINDIVLGEGQSFSFDAPNIKDAKAKNNAERAKLVWSFITNFRCTSQNGKTATFDSDIGERFDGYILNGMLKAADVKLNIEGAPSGRKIGDLKNQKADNRNDVVKAVENFNIASLASASSAKAAVVANYFTNPIYGGDFDGETTTALSAIERTLRDLALGATTVSELEKTAKDSKELKSVVKAIKKFDKAYDGDFAAAFNAYSENVALYDLYYLDLLLQLYAISATNNPSGNTDSWQCAYSAKQWKNTCVNFIKAICGQSSGTMDGNDVKSDPHKCGIVMMMGTYSYGIDTNNKYKAAVIGANDLILAENNLMATEDALTAAHTQGAADKYTVTKQYCGYAVGANMSPQKMKDAYLMQMGAFTVNANIINIQNTQVKEALGKSTVEEWGSYAVSALNKYLGLTEAFNETAAATDIQKLAESYQTYTNRLANAIAASAKDKSSQMYSYTSSGDKTWYGYISGRAMFPVLFNISSDGKVTIRNNGTVQSSYDNYGKGFLATIGQYHTARGDFYQMGTIPYTEAETSNPERYYGQIGALYTIPLQPYPLVGGAPPAEEIKLYASIDVSSAALATMGGYIQDKNGKNILDDKTVIVADKEKTLKVLTENAYKYGTNLGFIRMTDKTGKILNNAPEYALKDSNGNNLGTQDAYGTDITFNLLKYSDKTNTCDQDELDKILTYFGAFKTKNKKYIPDTESNFRQVNYTTILADTWRYATQNLSSKKEGESWDSVKDGEAYTTNDPVVIALRIPDYLDDYNDAAIQKWINARQKDSDIKLTVRLYNDKGELITNKESDFCDKDGYALNVKLDGKESKASDKATYLSVGWLLNCIKDGKSILTESYDKKQSKACNKIDTNFGSKNCTVDKGDSNEEYCSFTAVVTLTKTNTEGKSETISTVTDNKSDKLPKMFKADDDPVYDHKTKGADRNTFTVKVNGKDEDVLADNRCNVAGICFSYDDATSPSSKSGTEVYVHFQLAQKVDDAYSWVKDGAGNYTSILEYYPSKAYDRIKSDAYGNPYTLDIKDAEDSQEMKDLVYKKETNEMFIGSEGGYKICTGMSAEIMYRDADGNYYGSSAKHDGGRFAGLSMSDASYVYKTAANISNNLKGGRIDIFIPVYKDTDTNVPSWEAHVYYIIEDKEIPVDAAFNIPMTDSYTYTAEDEYEYMGQPYYFDSTSYANWRSYNEDTFQTYTGLKVYADTLVHEAPAPDEPGIVNIYIPFVRPVEDLVYHSVPEAFAEMKNANKTDTPNLNDTGRADPNYQELFEAMAGVPSTELLYFSVGGSEFIVEFRAELEKQVVERTYCTHFNKNDCEFEDGDRLHGYTGVKGEKSNKTQWATVMKDGAIVGKNSTSDGNDSVSSVVHFMSDKTTEWYNIPAVTRADTNTYDDISAHTEDSNFSITWTGTIENADGSKKPSDHKNATDWDNGPSNNAYVDRDGEATDSNAKTGFYGEPGAMGDERNNDYTWKVTDYNKDLEEAIAWAKSMEEISDTDKGQIANLANSDGVIRSWHSGNATITIEFKNISNKKQADEQLNLQENGTLYGNEKIVTNTGSADENKLDAHNDPRLGTTWREDYGAKAERKTDGAGEYGSLYDYNKYLANKKTVTEDSHLYITTYKLPTEADGSKNISGGTPTPVYGSFNYTKPIAAITGDGSGCSHDGYTITNPSVPQWHSCTVHVHDSGCYDKNGNLTCGNADHTHGDGNCNAYWDEPGTGSYVLHTCKYTAGAFIPLVETEAKQMKDVTYTIKVTFENPYVMSDGLQEGAITTKETLFTPADTLPAHALCGPCCSHELKAIEDTWSQRAEVWSVRLTDLNVMMLDEGYVEGMSEIRAGLTEVDDATDVLEALIIQGQPNVFYNVAASLNGMRKVKSRDAGYTGLVVQDGSVSGRLRYSLQTSQDDNVYWEEKISGTAKRSNWCDGTKATISPYNPAPDGGRGHDEAWATGMLYSHSDFRHWIDLHKRNISNKTGYNGYYSDNLDRLTKEWERFDMRRKLEVEMTVISDFLILQTSSGDQPIMYYDRKVKTTAQEDFPAVRWNTSSEAWAAMVTSNPYCIKSEALNKGGYNGLYSIPSVKYLGTGGGWEFHTAFDNDYDSYITNRAKDEKGLAEVPGHPMYNYGNFLVTGTGTGEAQSSSQGNATNGISNCNTTTRYYHNDTTLSRKYYTGNKDADITSASLDQVRKGKCSGDQTYKAYGEGASTGASIYHSSSPCFGQLRLARPTNNLKITEVFTQYIENTNKEYTPGQSHVVYHPIIDVSYAKDKTAQNDYSKIYQAEDIEVKNPATGNTLLKLYGWQKDAIYAVGKHNVNSIVVHDPVSVQVAFVVGQDKSLDQRVLPEDRTAAINEALADIGHCSGDPLTCDHRLLTCTYYQKAGSGVNLCSTCKGECAWNSNKKCDACGSTGMGKCVICGGSGIYRSRECTGCGGTGLSFHTASCYTSSTAHESVEKDYYNGVTGDADQEKIDWNGDLNDGSYKIKSVNNVHTLKGGCFLGKSAGFNLAFNEMLLGDYSDLKKMLGEKVWSEALKTFPNLESKGHEHNEGCYTIKTDMKDVLELEKLKIGDTEYTFESRGPRYEVRLMNSHSTSANSLSNFEIKIGGDWKTLEKAASSGLISGLSVASTPGDATGTIEYSNIDGFIKGEAADGKSADLVIRFTTEKDVTGVKVNSSTATSGIAEGKDGITVLSGTQERILTCTNTEGVPGVHECEDCQGTGRITDSGSYLKTGDIYSFTYTGDVQAVTLPAGTYRLEAWGAQGGMYTDGAEGGLGGYTDGLLTLDKETTLYVYVGSKGGNGSDAAISTGGYNGGGNGYGGGGAGGGATDFRLIPYATDTYAGSTFGNAMAYDSLVSRILVAGGGAGSDKGGIGGNGGGLTGSNSSGISKGEIVKGGTQTSGGYSSKGAGTFGVGGGSSRFKTTYISKTTAQETVGYYSKTGDTKNTAYWWTYGDTDYLRTEKGKAAGMNFKNVLTPGHEYEVAYDVRSSAGNDTVTFKSGTTEWSVKTSTNTERKSIRFVADGTDFQLTSGDGTKDTLLISSITVADVSVTGSEWLDGAGGGAGWYGGGSGWGGENGGAGGSSYIMNITSVAPVEYTGIAFIDGEVKTGKQTGNGMARITVVSVSGHDKKCSTCKGKGEVATKLDVSKDTFVTFLKARTKDIPLYVGDIVNPIWDCGLHGDSCTKHSCTSNCGLAYTLTCSEPHHFGEHGDYGSECYSACNNDDNHKRSVDQATFAGRAAELGNFILLDNYFDVYFANVGDFHETDDYGLYDTQVAKGMGYINSMDTTKWTREKLIKFPYPALYERFDGQWEEYRANEWIELEVRDNNGKAITNYHFYCPLYADEVTTGTVEYAVEAINTTWRVMDSNGAYWNSWQEYSYEKPGKYWLDKAYVRDNEYSNTALNDCPIDGTVTTNAQRKTDLTSYHTVWKQNAIDVTGRIGNLLIEDTDDMRYSNLFKTSKTDSWQVEGLIHDVDVTDPYGYMSWHYNAGGLATDIRGLQIIEKAGAAYYERLMSGNTESSDDYRNEYSTSKYIHNVYDYYNTYGKLKWSEQLDNTYDAAMPITSSNNRDADLNKFESLQDNEMKLGYGFLWDIQTIGSYHNGLLDVKPYIYALNTETGELIPADIYMGSETSGYQAVNIFGLEDLDHESAEYQSLKGKLAEWYMYFEFNKTQRRRNITKEELLNTAEAAECTRTYVTDADGKVVTVTVQSPDKQLYSSVDEYGNEIWILADRSGDESEIEMPLMRDPVMPAGDYANLGTMQHLVADGHARTFIGSPEVYAAVIDKQLIDINLTTFDDHRFDSGSGYTGGTAGMGIAENPDANTKLLDTPDSFYAAHGQRWHLTTKLPSSAVVTLYRGEHKTPLETVTVGGKDMKAYEEIKNLDGKWLLLVTVDINCDGEVYSLHYSQGDNNGVITSKGNTYTFKDGKADSSIQTGTEFTIPTLLAVYEANENNDVDYQIMQTH